MKKLAYWLASEKRNFDEGVDLLRELDIDRDLARFLSVKNPQKMHVSMLEKALFNHARIHKVKPQQRPEYRKLEAKTQSKPKVVKMQPSVAPQQPKPENTMKEGVLVHVNSNPSIDVDKLPEDLKAKYFKNAELKGMFTSLHAELKAKVKAGAPIEERAELTTQLLNARKEYKDNWADIDEWYATAKDKTPEQLAAEEALAIEKRKAANLNYIRRNWNKPEAAEELEERKVWLTKHNVEYEGLIERLKSGKK